MRIQACLAFVLLVGVELDAEVERTIRGYDADGSGAIEAAELDGGSRLALGGFVRQHAEEIDADADRVITRAELVAVVGRMFARADGNGDDRITPAELAKLDQLSGRPRRRPRTDPQP